MGEKEIMIKTTKIETPLGEMVARGNRGRCLPS